MWKIYDDCKGTWVITSLKKHILMDEPQQKHPMTLAGRCGGQCLFWDSGKAKPNIPLPDLIKPQLFITLIKK